MFKGHIVFILLVFLSVASAAPAKGSSKDPSNDPSSGNPDLNSGGSANPSNGIETATNSKPVKFVPTHDNWSFVNDPQPAVVDNRNSGFKISDSVKNALKLKWRNLARVFTRRDLTPEEPLGRLLSADLQRIHSVEQAIRYLRVSPPSESSNVLSLTSKNTCSALSFLVNEMHAPSSAIKSQAVQVIRDNWSDIFRWIEHLAAKFVFNDRFTDYDRRDLLALALPIILHVPLGGDDRRQFLEQTNEAPTLFSLLSRLWFHDMNHSKVTYSPSQQAMLVFSGILKQSPEALESRVFQALADNRDVLSATCVSFFSKETWNLRSRVATDSVNLPICAQYILCATAASGPIRHALNARNLVRVITTFISALISNSSKLVTLPGLTPRIVKDSLLQSCNNCLGLLIWNGYLEGQRWVVSMLRGGILLSLLQMPKLFPGAKAGTITEAQDYSRVLIIKILTPYLVYPQVLHCFQRSLRSIDGREIPAYLQDEDTWGRLLQQNSQLSAQWKIYKVVEPPVCCYSIVSTASLFFQIRN
ncbi:hypothetical protein GG344DRAFT_74850 [Lentinula edodes]|nr:hypothetical protein GG344DRAFT_74850 [Lentinula edodes]